MYDPLRLTPLDSETGWTGELWSKTNSSNNKTKRKALFSGEKNMFLSDARGKKQRVLISNGDTDSESKQSKLGDGILSFLCQSNV